MAGDYKSDATDLLAAVDRLMREERLELPEAVRAATGQQEPQEGTPTVGQLVDRYLDALERDGKRTAANLVRENSRCRAVSDAPIASVLASELERADVARWMEWLCRTRGQGPTTVNRSVAFGSAAWMWGQEFGLAPEDRNPFRAVRRARERVREKGETLTPKEVEILAGLAAPDFATLIRVAFWTAARPKELYALEWRDIQLDGCGGSIMIRPEEEKSRRGRRVPVTPALASLLRQIRGGRNVKPLPTARVLVRACGRPWTARACCDRMAALRDTLTDDELPYAKRTGLVFYDLRAASITRMLGAGIPPAVVQRIAGHAHISTCMRYCGTLGAEQEAQGGKP
jgi:integrase